MSAPRLVRLTPVTGTTVSVPVVLFVVLVNGCSSTKVDVAAALERRADRASAPSAPVIAGADAGAPVTPPLEKLVVDTHSHLFNALDLPLAGFARSFAIGKGVPPVVVDNSVIKKFLEEVECRVYQATPGFVARKGARCQPAEGPESVGMALQAIGCLLSSDRACVVPKIGGATEKKWSLCKMVARLDPTTPPCSTPSGDVEEPAGDDKAAAIAADLWKKLAVVNAVEETLARTGFGVSNKVKSVTSVIGIVLNALLTATSDRLALAKQLAKATPEVDVFVSLLVDFDFWTERNVLHDIRDCDRMNAIAAAYSHLGIAEQIEAHEQVLVSSLQGNIKGSRGSQYVLPFVPYNPLRDIVAKHCPIDIDGKPRESSLALVTRAIQEKGFVGVKLYPPTGFLPTGNAELPDAGNAGRELDEALDAFYDFCVENDVPIVAHANDSNAFGVDYGWRAGPWAWRRVLAAHPKLRVSFGHFGELTGAADPDHRIECLSWADGFADLMSSNANVYADFSFSDGATNKACEPHAKCPADPKDVPAACKERCLTETLMASIVDKTAFFSSDIIVNTVASRVMYGSDWWMTELAGPHQFDGYFDRAAGMIESIGEMVKADKLLSSLLFDEKVFSNDVLGGNALKYLGLDDKTRLAYQRMLGFICSPTVQAQKVEMPRFMGKDATCKR